MSRPRHWIRVRIYVLEKCFLSLLEGKTEDDCASYTVDMVLNHEMCTVWKLMGELWFEDPRQCVLDILRKPRP
jgi:hypothetical protein